MIDPSPTDTDSIFSVSFLIPTLPCLQAKLALWNCIIKKTLHLAEDAMNGESGTQIVCTAVFDNLLSCQQLT
jgi:hypothetical protein